MYNSTGQLLLQGPVGLLLTSADKRIQLIIEAIQAPVGTQFSLVKHSDASMVKSLAKRLKITEANGSSRLSTGIMELSLAGPNPTALIQTLNAIAKTTQAKDAQKKAQEAAQARANANANKEELSANIQNKKSSKFGRLLSKMNKHH